MDKMRLPPLEKGRAGERLAVQRKASNGKESRPAASQSHGKESASSASSSQSKESRSAASQETREARTIRPLPTGEVPSAKPSGGEGTSMKLNELLSSINSGTIDTVMSSPTCKAAGWASA